MIEPMFEKGNVEEVKKFLIKFELIVTYSYRRKQRVDHQSPDISFVKSLEK